MDTSIRRPARVSDTDAKGLAKLPFPASAACAMVTSRSPSLLTQAPLAEVGYSPMTACFVGPFRWECKNTRAMRVRSNAAPAIGA